MASWNSAGCRSARWDRSSSPTTSRTCRTSVVVLQEGHRDSSCWKIGAHTLLLIWLQGAVPFQVNATFL